MTMDRTQTMQLVRKAGELLAKESGRLSEIDSRFGDGDHGITIGKIAALMIKSADNLGEESLHDFFENLGSGIMGVNGGSAGPLYGTLIGGLAEGLSGDTAEIDGETLRAMLVGSREAMFEISKARVGDKTMMDALIPAVEAAEKAPNDVREILVAAAAAAEAGATASEQFVSKFGRARSYKEQTIGTPDAGAVSTALLFRGLCNGLDA